MRFLASLSLLASLVAAQYGDNSNSGSSSSSSSSSSHSAASTTASAASGVQTVDVGEDGLVFNPNSITAAPGSKVVFQFYPGDHSVAQADFDGPCKPAASGNGFWSGFINSNSGPAPNVFTLTINDTNPLWFYCAQTGHCAGGMVGVINPPSGGGQTLDAFKSAASSAGSGSAPKSVQGGAVGPASSAAASGTSATSAGSSASAAATQKSVAVAVETKWSFLAAVVLVLGAAGGFASWIL